MAEKTFKDTIEFERNLKPGDKVVARWTNSYMYFSAHATVTKVNAKSVIVTLDEAVPTGTGGGYPVGNKIKCPLVFGDTWSTNNCVVPTA